MQCPIEPSKSINGTVLVVEKVAVNLYPRQARLIITPPTAGAVRCDQSARYQTLALDASEADAAYSLLKQKAASPFCLLSDNSVL
jgi:hypothetical protein